jgi:hypothetical protein
MFNFALMDDRKAFPGCRGISVHDQLRAVLRCQIDLWWKSSKVPMGGNGILPTAGFVQVRAMRGAGSVPCTANQLMVAGLQAKGYIANIPFLLRARGELCIDILGDALQIIVDRHAILRALFSQCGDTLVYTPIPGVGIGLPVTDVSTAADPLAIVLRDLAEDGRRPFAFGDLPRLRARVFRLGAKDHVVSLMFDHLAADGISLGIIAAEWRSLYQAIMAGVPFEIPPIAPQYQDFALWQQGWLKGREAGRQRQAWLGALAGFPARDAAATPYAAEILQFELERDIVRHLSAACVRHRVKPFIAMLVSYVLLLVSATGERDLIIGTVRANRRRPDSAAMVGHFANLLPLPIRVDPRQPLESFVSDAAAICKAAYARDELPFLDIAAAAWRERKLPAARLAEFTINFVPFPAAPVLWGDALRMEQIWGLFTERPSATSRVSFFVRQQGARVGGTLIYDRQSIDPNLAAAFPARLSRAITSLAEGAGRTVADLLSN